MLLVLDLIHWHICMMTFVNGKHMYVVVNMVSTPQMDLCEITDIIHTFNSSKLTHDKWLIINLSIVHNPFRYVLSVPYK